MLVLIERSTFQCINSWHFPYCMYVVSISLIGQKQLTLVGFRAKKEQKGQAAPGQNGGKDKAFSRSKKVSTLKISDF